MRDTGATPDQITDALRRAWDGATKNMRSRRGTFERFAYSERIDARIWAEYLVPPDHRIVGPDDMAAIRYANAVLGYVLDCDGDEMCTEMLYEALNYYPHDDGPTGHKDRLDDLVNGHGLVTDSRG